MSSAKHTLSACPKQAEFPEPQPFDSDKVRLLVQLLPRGGELLRDSVYRLGLEAHHSHKDADCRHSWKQIPALALSCQRPLGLRGRKDLLIQAPQYFLILRCGLTTGHVAYIGKIQFPLALLDK